MSDKKIIIRNCPAYDYDEEFNYHMCKQPLIPYECSVDDCKDCTDCVVKQIVKKCNNIKKDHYWGMREIRFSKEILELLDVQEVE